ncbi:MAG: hypothetical protein K6E50_02765 [Lachnospiraceae bacterium]|nr:hypothetical protein [Lachnospiraceae bacterium]
MKRTGKHKRILGNTVSLLAMLFLVLPLCGCSFKVCDFCGRKRVCGEYDVLGVTRYICDDCLNDPRIAVSGNMVRTYSEMYENGTLEYPEGSPMRADAGEQKEEPSVTGEAALPTLTEDVHIEIPVDQSAADNGGTNTLPPTPTPVPAQQPDSNTGAQGLSGTALIDKLNASLAADNMQLAASGNEGEYKVVSGDTDLGIRMKVSKGSNSEKDVLVVEQGRNASSSDYVKAAIRSILCYMNSDDYEGLGHDIYNQTIQNGDFRYEGLLFRSVVHTADEIEKGSPVSDYSIIP